MKKFLLYVAVAISAVACVYPDSSLPTAGPSESLNIATGDVTVSSDAGTTIVKVVSSADWTARMTFGASQSKGEWCSMDIKSGAGDSSKATDITVTYDANTSYGERSATLYVTSGNYNKSIKITQKQLDVINVTTDQFNIPAEGETFNIEVKSNVTFETTYDTTCGWIKTVENASRAYATRQTRFKVEPNDSAEERQTEVKFTYKDITKVVTIIQAGKSEE